MEFQSLVNEKKKKKKKKKKDTIYQFVARWPYPECRLGLSSFGTSMLQNLIETKETCKLLL